MHNLQNISSVKVNLRRPSVFSPLSSDLRPPPSVLRPHSSLAFTLIEMLVVMGMLAILMGVAFSGLGQARKQAKVAKANAEVRELVNAILSYEGEQEELSVMSGGKVIVATEGNLKELLGKGKTTQVYLNAPMENNAFLDPWKHEYRFRVMEESVEIDKNPTIVSAAITFPNRQRELRW